MTDFTIEMGVPVREVVSGFAGTVVGRAQYLTGCNVYLLQPKVKTDGGFDDPRWFDEHRLEVQAGDAVTRPGTEARKRTGDGGADIAPPLR